MGAPALVLRRTTPADLPAVVFLFTQRDGYAHDPSVLSPFLWDLDPEKFLGWIAFVDGEPAALNCLYLRTLAWGSREVKAGYWSHLFVREEFRRLLIYPRLVASMLKEAPAEGIELIYTATRRRHVAETHKKMGFSDLGEFQVLLKPLRPFELLGRYRSNRFLNAAAPLLDLPFILGSHLRAPGQASFAPTPAQSLPIKDPTAPILGADPRISQRWSQTGWSRRFGATIQAEPYQILKAGAPGSPQAQLLFALARRSRENAQALPINLCVLMDLLGDPNHEAEAVALLRNAEAIARRAGCHGLMWLDGLPEWSSLFRRLGFRVTPETYTLLAWPKTGFQAGAWGAEKAHWRFPFSEHDAF